MFEHAVIPELYNHGSAEDTLQHARNAFAQIRGTSAATFYCGGKYCAFVVHGPPRNAGIPYEFSMDPMRRPCVRLALSGWDTLFRCGVRYLALARLHPVLFAPQASRG
jgi:hypothetical protein